MPDTLQRTRRPRVQTDTLRAAAVEAAAGDTLIEKWLLAILTRGETAAGVPNNGEPASPPDSNGSATNKI
jgi:hypothetical protein